MSRAEIETLITQVEAASDSAQDRVPRLIGAAELIAAKGYPLEAYELCRKALAIETRIPRPWFAFDECLRD